MGDAWVVKVTLAVSRRKLLPGCSLRSHAGVSCICSHPRCPPSWKEGVKQQLSAESSSKEVMSLQLTDRRTINENPQQWTLIAAFFPKTSDLTSLKLLLPLAYQLQGNVLLSHRLWSEPEPCEVNSSLLAIIKFVRSQIQQWNCYW